MDLPETMGTTPHGGRLIDRILSPDQAEEVSDRASRLPGIRLDARALSDFEMIVQGAFSPLEGFMGRSDYESVVATMRLANGLPWSLPITLPVGDQAQGGIRAGSELALRDADGALVGLLQVSEIFRRDRRREAEQVYGTTSPEHPGVRALLESPDTLLAGKVSALSPVVDTDFREHQLTPAQTRQIFAQRGWRTIVGFQTRNPIHRAHEYIQKCALETVDGLLVHPLVGETKGDDIPAGVRMRCYEVLLKWYYPSDRTLLAVFPAAMRYAGPREAIFHALVRKNYGCTHFVVGRDHAGVGNFYGPFDAHKIFGEFKEGELGIMPLFFDHTFYCRRCLGMVSAKTCPHGPEHHIALSGTRVREMLSAGEIPPPEFTRPEVAQILIEALRESR